METGIKTGKYIYCVIKDNEPKNFSLPGIGGMGEEAHTVCFDGLAAVVSNSQMTNYVVSRENTLAHEKVIEEIMKEYTVLPVRFNTIAKDEEKIKKILERERDKFENKLNMIKDKKELGLKAMFKEDIIYDDILKTHEDIRKLKEKIARLTPEETYYQRMKIGKMVEEALEEEKERYKKEILDILEPLAEDIKINKIYGERMILNAAFLITKDKETEFDCKIQELDEKYGAKIKFKYVGTVPPFNFVNLVIRTEGY